MKEYKFYGWKTAVMKTILSNSAKFTGRKKRNIIFAKICSMLISASAIVIMYYTFIEEMKQT